MTTEKDKMLSGEFYNATDFQLSLERRRARDLLKTLNDSSDVELETRQEIITQLFGTIGERIWIEPPFYCDYGNNIHLGHNVFFNFNCVILDPARVDIGSNVFFGPNVQIYTATHPMDAQTRRTGLEFAQPISIGSDVWIGGSAIICPGINIGDRSVIGAGSVITKDIPQGVLAVGIPSRIIRQLE